MAVLESFLVTTLAPSIAKATLKLWLKDRQIAQDVSSDVIDLLKKKTEDTLARNRGERVFRDIGERVALSLQPTFGEFSAAQALLVGRVVADTLSKAKISTDLLAERNLDPMRLAQYMKVNTRPAFDFNEAAQVLYDAVMAETCQHIVDIASSLPGFTERTFSEVLKREDELKDAGKKILDEVQQLRQAIEKQNPEMQAARFEENYRRAVARHLDFVEIFGVDLSKASRRQKLSIAYISLSVEQDARTLQPTDAKLPAASVQNIEEPTTVTLSAESALARSKRVLIRGEAGSGKTTLMRWIAVQSAQAKFSGALQNWNDTLPFFIRLRQFAEGDLPRPEAFPAHIAPSIAGEMPVGWMHEQLRSGKAVVLVDGVDEVPEGRRNAVRDWLRDLITAFPQGRYIITSRPYAVGEGWIRELSFDDAELQPMDIPQINAFIEHWHSAVRESIDYQDESLATPTLEMNLKAIIRDSSKPIRRLATSPLLCAMICAMHHDRKQQLPQDRIELYEAGCYMLLERRDIERGLTLREYPALKYRQKRLLLQDLAYWMIKNDLSEADAETVANKFDHILPGMADIGPGVTGRDVTRFFVERSGIIREPVKERIDFAHRTFEEFLAAQNALDEEDLGLLVKNAHNDQWREVIILAVGLASPKRRERLITELIARGDGDEVHRHQLYLLAVACLEVAVEMEPYTRDQVAERMKQVIPPKTFTEAKQLASAGELAVPFLRYQRTAVRTAAACVRTLSTIGSDSAIEAMRSYAADPRALVREELMKAASTVDPAKNYIARVLHTWQHAQFRGLSTLDGVDGMSDIEVLLVTELPAQCDLSPVMACKKLRHLEISAGHPMVVPESLGELCKLEHLALSEEISPVPPLMRTPEAVRRNRVVLETYLQRVGCAILPETIGQLRDLEELELYNFRLRALPKSIGHLRSLRFLSLRGTLLRELPGSLKHLQNLRVLDLGATFLDSLPEWLVELRNLKRLILPWSTVPKDVRGLLKAALPHCTVRPDRFDRYLEVYNGSLFERCNGRLLFRANVCPEDEDQTFGDEASVDVPSA